MQVEGKNMVMRFQRPQVYILIKTAGEWRFNPSVLRAKGDRLMRARALSVGDNGAQNKNTYSS